ncbi:EpsG family protein [Novosphingobium jiangmenense]|uniref:EpsG family protein n=1 Tax=Novosphingobium jiangmenense TaxID=2791981 RepID=A0ABS0HBJ6_9SPHN|nr:EpsG family protein [Novosphingobium jiangmenense]MBF9149650.1 EpsG family protein [Novosphingobium jiangmenense]
MLYVALITVLFMLRYALAGRGMARVQIYYPVLLGLFLFSAFRYQVGCDWSGYYYQYVGAANFDWSSLTRIQEPIWWAILAWINESGFPYPVANIASSAVFFVGIHILARRQPDPLGFLVLLFPILIINMPMSGIRQGAAIGLICIAFTAFTDRRPLRFALWVVLAAGFHTSALVFMLLLPLATGRYTRGRLILAALLALPGVYFQMASEAFDVATSRYIDTGIDAVGAAFRVSILGLSALYFLLFARKEWPLAWPKDYSLASIGAIGMALACLLVPVSTVIGDRFGYYLIPVQAMIFARIPYLAIRKNAGLHSAFPYLGLFLVFVVWSQVSWHFEQCYVPYQTWIFGFPGGDSVGF